MYKTIYFFWFQGMSDAPKIVNKCLESWIYYNKDWKIVILDKANYIDYTDLVYDEKISLTKFSDFLRLSILNKHGGLWVDSTCFCNKPLNEWLPEKCFIFENLNISYTISTWFIYSEPNNYLIEKWYNSCLTSSNQEYIDHYFYFHIIFDKLCNTDIEFENAWNDVKKINQNDNLMYFDINKYGNLHVKSDGFLEPLTNEVKSIILDKKKYLFKLSYKYDGNIRKDSILSFLFSTIEGVFDKNYTS